MTSQLAVIVSKEVRDNLRDRRAMTTALIMPLMGPLTMVAVFFAIRQGEEKTRAPHVPVLAQENAPELMKFLTAQGVVVEAAPASDAAAEALVREAKTDVVLRIPSDFGSHLRQGTPAVVEIICDPTRQDARPTLTRIEKLLEGYGHAIGSLRLLERGVDPSIAEAVKSEVRDVSAPGAEKVLLLGSFPLFLLIACFVSGLYIAIDITAGEKERGSLEPLLLNPVASTTFVLAKVLATVTFGFVGVLISVASFALVLPSVPFEDIGIDVHLAGRTIAAFILLFAPTVVLAAALQVFVGTVSKNTKTAQASLGLILLVPLIPGLVVSLFPQQPSALLCLVPTLGESILAIRLVRGEDISIVHWLCNAGADLTLAAIFVVVSARLFGARMLSG